MKKNKNAMAIVLAIVLTIVMGIIAIYIIDYIIPFSKNVKGIENVAKAYYQAEKGVEDSLYFVKNNFGTDSLKTFNSTLGVDYSYNIIALGDILPPYKKGNSEYNKDFNRLRTGEPIQLKIGNGRLSGSDWDNINFTIRVPDLNGDGNNNETLSGSTSTPIINWQLISPNGVLNATGASLITVNDFNIINSALFSGGGNNGIELDGSPENFKNYYSNNCGVGKECILKMSVINKLELNVNNIPIPYLEWKIDLSGTSKKIPLRYTKIHTEGKSYGFKKTLDIRVPQQTVNEAFDFTVFQ